MKQGNKKLHGKTSRRVLRVRKPLRGSSDCPRMCVNKTNKHVYVQLIDDSLQKTVASASTCTSDFSKGESFSRKNKENAKVLGEMIAKQALSLGISAVIFDRGPCKYHGILAELADAARQQGLRV